MTLVDATLTATQQRPDMVPVLRRGGAGPTLVALRRCGVPQASERLDGCGRDPRV